MFEGGILKEGTPEELAADETVRRVYLGQDFELKKKKFQILFLTLALLTIESNTYHKIAIGIAKNFKNTTKIKMVATYINFILLSFQR